MKIVFITIPWFSPAFKAGGPIRSITNLVNKFDKDVQYRIFCSNKDVDGTPINNIETNKWVSYNAHSMIWYDDSSFSYMKLRRLVKEQQADVIYIIGMFSLSFNIFPMLFGNAEKVIVSPRGMLHPSALSMKKVKKRLFLNLLKITGMHKRCHFHAADVVERKYIEQIFEKTSSVTIAGNYATVYNAEKNKHKNKGELKLITIALVSPMKNHLIVLKALKECKGLIEYHIIGSIKDQAYWEKCLEVMKQIPDNIKVTYHGEIPPDQISRFFIDSPVLILPSESESYGHSIFEALSAGIPVITSGNTPWNELQENNAGININPNVHEIKESINYYLSFDNQEYDASSLAAVAYLKKKYNERDLFEEYKALLLN